MADRHGVIAPITEGTAGGQIAGIGHHALDRLELGLSMLQIRERIEQSFRIRMPRVFEDVAQRTMLHDCSGIDNRHLIANFRYMPPEN